MKPRFVLILFAVLALAALFFSPAQAEVPPGTLQPNDLLVGQEGGIALYSWPDGTFKGYFINPGTFPDQDSFNTDGNTRNSTVFGPDGNLYVTITDPYSRIARFNGTTGAYMDDFVPPLSGGLDGARGLAFGLNGDLYVSCGGWRPGATVETYDTTASLGPVILRLNGRTGAFISAIQTSPFSDEPNYLVTGADGNIYYNTTLGIAIHKLDVQNQTITPWSWSDFFDTPGQMEFGPDGRLWATSTLNRSDGATSGSITVFGPGSSTAYPGVYPADLAFGPDGRLYFNNILNDELRYLDLTTGRTIRLFGIGYAYYTPGILLFVRGATSVGTSVTIKPTTTASLTFDQVTASGQTSVTPLDSASANLPPNFEIAGQTSGFPTYFDITSTASFTGAVQIGIAYDPAQFPYDPVANPTGDKPALLHFVNGAWVDITTSIDTVNHKVYGQTFSFSPFAIAKRHLLSWSGVLQPINADGSSVFKRGSTVPVKFQLTGASASITNLNAKLYLAQADSVDPITANEAVSTSAADTGNTFRYDPTAGQYIFNLSTTNLSQGTWYLRIDLGDGTNNIVRVKLKK
ncbi:MAG TPA: PxKF domain-containing protein [Chthonomonadaceae bacterium]|nr:PxKF domain-containing protein [Chthonomonadaceae bacterium]